MLRLVGNLEQSRTILEQRLAIAQKLRDQTSASDISGILFSLGNTARVQGETDAALDFYQKAPALAPSLTTKTQIQLAQVNLLVDSDRLVEAQNLLPPIQSQLAQLPPGRLAAYARVDLAQSAIKINCHGTKAASPYNLNPMVICPAPSWLDYNNPKIVTFRASKVFANSIKVIL